ncbi:hypothetical protein ID855_20480, partial [Xenorhabdus sp. ZM]|uniref:hypothetical protein n=1 Tax=Xenorhabdus szentirmaii TaxID=290112 RepID=UPI00199598D8
NYENLFNKEFLSYFDMMGSEAWDKMEDNNIDIRDGLVNILAELENASLSIEPIFALKEQCQRLLSDYYHC